jgi:membrane protein DedA with SNARE-associated domain
VNTNLPVPLMEPLALFVEHWGYAAIFVVVVLGNLGLPVPEETILTLAGYLVCRGDLELKRVLIVAIASASFGDNCSYWLGRTLGVRAVRSLRFNQATLETLLRFVVKHGALAVFLGRFVPGLRFAAGPLAGIAGIPAAKFLIANVLGACCYVPVVVGIGYAVGRGVGPRLEHFRTTAFAVELAVLAAAILGILWALVMRARRSRRPERPGASVLAASVRDVATPPRP